MPRHSTAGSRLLAQALASAQLTQADAAQRLGVTQQTVSDWIAGGSVPRGQNLLRLREAFGISLESWFESEKVTKPRGRRRSTTSTHRVARAKTDAPTPTGTED